MLSWGQRLVRKLCQTCRQWRSATADEQEVILNILKNHPFPPLLNEPIKICEAGGCEACNHTGFKGRQGLFEAVVVDTKIKSILNQNPEEQTILNTAKQQKIPTLAEDAVTKILLGITSLAEVERVVDLYQG